MTSRKRQFSTSSTKIIQTINLLKDTDQSYFKSIHARPFYEGNKRAKQASNGIDIRKFMESLELQSAKRIANRWEVNSSNLTSFMKIDLLEAATSAENDVSNNGKLSSYARKKSLGSSGNYKVLQS